MRVRRRRCRFGTCDRQREDDHRHRAERQQHLPAQPRRPVAAGGGVVIDRGAHALRRSAARRAATVRERSPASPRSARSDRLGELPLALLARGEVRLARPAPAVPSMASMSSSGVRCVMAPFPGSSSNWQARGRSWPSPRRPSCPARRRSAGATCRDTSAGSTSRAASSAGSAIALRTATARSSRIIACCAPSMRTSSKWSVDSIGSVDRRLRADAIEADVDGDPIEPRRQRRLALEILEPAPRAHERILREVAGVLVIVHEAIADLIDGAPMPLDDHVERLALAGRRGGDERRIVQSASDLGVSGRPASPPSPTTSRRRPGANG